MKKLLALLLCLALCLSCFAACNSSDNRNDDDKDDKQQEDRLDDEDDDKKDNKDDDKDNKDDDKDDKEDDKKDDEKSPLVGTWELDATFMEFAMIGTGGEELFPGVDYEWSAKVKGFNLILRDDGTYTFKIDPEEFNDSAKDYFQEMIDFVTSDAYLDTVAQESGYDSLDALLEAASMSKEDFVESIKSGIDESILDGLTAENFGELDDDGYVRENGEYKVDDDTIITDPEKGAKDIMDYELSSDGQKLSLSMGEVTLNFKLASTQTEK